jgi:XTP/dITP diphosphohydrolase
MNRAANNEPLTLVLATRNRHKVAEIQAILGPEVVCQSLFDFPDVPPLSETADSFSGNAAGKARQLAASLSHGIAKSSALVLADDSGLEVDALNGAPGVLSARFAADETPTSGNAPDQANNAKLLRLLKQTPTEQRTARFRCVLALLQVSHKETESPPHLFEGTCEGRIGHKPAGRSGFGYDPLFLPTGFDCTFAELGEERKNRISHRRKALEALQRWISIQRIEGRGLQPQTP